MWPLLFTRTYFTISIAYPLIYYGTGGPKHRLGVRRRLLADISAVGLLEGGDGRGNCDHAREVLDHDLVGEAGVVSVTGAPGVLFFN